MEIESTFRQQIRLYFPREERQKEQEILDSSPDFRFVRGGPAPTDEPMKVSGTHNLTIAYRETNVPDRMATVLRDIINGAAHPDVAVRRVLVDLKPIRKILAEYDALVKLPKS